MKRILYALAVLGAMSFGALDARAGGSLKDTAAPLAEAGRCVGGAFSGAYFGAQIGGGSLRSGQDIEDGAASFSDSGAAFTIGTHSGYNVQCGRVLFGIESDFNYFQADTNSSQDYICSGPDCGEVTGGTTSFKTSMDWFGTLRGRLGLVHTDNILIYATGGLAYADVEHTFSDTGPGFSQSNRNMEYGWTAGGGVEFLRNGPWSIRADALYVDLGSEDRTYSLGDCENCTLRSRWDDTFWVARVGFTYHIGDLRREEPVVPLK